MKWNELKEMGSSHYKTGDVQPIDLYCSLGIFTQFAIASIIKYASRMVYKGINESDLNKIIHYCELLKSNCDSGKKE